MKKKILIVDDSALMRRVLCDIINSDERFEVADMAVNGIEGFKLIVARNYDAVVLDVYMPQMTGLDMLREMQKSNVTANVLMASTTTGEGARETLTALELGAIDFIKKPENVADARHAEFRARFLDQLEAVSEANVGRKRISRPVSGSQDTKKTGPTFTARYDVNFHNQKTPATGVSMSMGASKPATAAPGVMPSSHTGLKAGGEVKLRPAEEVRGKKIVAIASSTGGPKALQEVIPKLPKNLNAPVLLVQHMPKGFTFTLAERLNELSNVTVTEAKEGEKLEIGHVYIAEGGLHLNAIKKDGGYKIRYTDEPSREGVKPCANYMYESLCNSDYDQIVCVVLTGMGCDGTAGIKALDRKKKIHVIAQDQETCTVYGMPKSIAISGLVNEVVPLEKVAEHITKIVGVR